MFQDYVEFSCIKKMTATYKDRFDNIVKEYAGKLNRIESDNGTVFTLHDFNHHCCNLFKIVSTIILNDDIAYNNSSYSLHDRELYILNIAILLHDLGMTKYVEFTRDNHAVISANMIREDYDNSSNPLSDGKSGLVKNEIEALALIVQAHSDVKDGSIPEEINGLKNPELTNVMPGRVNDIRARFLANILRLADELDVTTDRLGNVDIEKEIASFTEKITEFTEKLSLTIEEDKKDELKQLIKRCTSAQKSGTYWKRLSMIKNIDRDKAGNVTLYVDDKHIGRLLVMGENPQLLAIEVLDIFKKINDAFIEFNNQIESDLQYRTIVAMKTVNFFSNNDQLNLAIDDLKKKTGCADSKNIVDFTVPQVISTDIEKLISKFIEKRNLFEVGHYKLHDDLCARDWISVDEIILTESLFRKCETQFLLHIKERFKVDDDYIIIGIDFGGMLIASRLAFILKKPYTYIVPEYKEKKSSLREQEILISDFNKVIIVTDVIVTYQTIRNLLNNLGLNDKIEAIYAIMFRNAKDNMFIKDNQDLVKNTYVLNGSYNIELQSNIECKYRDQLSCKANNKSYD